MKKQKERFSLMTIKTFLGILLFTGMGVIIISGGCIIIKYTIILPDKTNLPIVDPVIETQCEIDPDCWLVYINDYICLPCDTSLENYKCLNEDEAKIFGGEKIDPDILCSRCEVEFDKYICKCENGECEKVKEELIEDVSIATNKTEYEQGETVEIMIENNSNREQKMDYPIYIIERFENNNWIEVKEVRCPCGADCSTVGPSPIKSKDKLKFEWDQQESWCDDSVSMIYSKKISKQVPGGIYRVKSVKRGINGTNDDQSIYSNEFTIKEKLVVDARCGKKVKGIGLCKRLAIGYEFDLNLEKCVEKRVGGYSFEIPFKTLKECQEVCEK